MSRRRLLVADLFCGAGGSSTGARRALEALGIRMQLVAVNHWPVAIETHQRNHPDARHYCVNLEAAVPRELVPEGRLDLLMASPECTHHSRARGGRPVNDQSRMSAWHVVRWCTELRVRALLVENVPEFRDWGPIGRDGRPLRSRRGEYFRAWVAALEAIGFRVDHRVLNAADYGDATTRERLFVLARSDRQPVRWPTPSHSRDGSADLYGAGAERWRAAREVIDWRVPGRSIFTRARPLSPKTLARIYAGAVRFGWPAPFLERLRAHMHEQGAAVARAPRGGSRAQPLVVRSAMHQSNALCVRSAEEPLATVTTDGGLALVEPFLLPQRSDASARSAERPAPTVTTVARVGLVEPFVLPQGGGGAARAAGEPMATIACDGAHALVAPYYGASGCQPVERPLPTVTTRDRFGLAVPFIAAAFGERAGQAPRVHSVDEPTPTICAKGRVNLVQAAPEVDVLFRMLQPHELAAAMGFDADEAAYEFAGNKTQITAQIGNAVPVRTASALVGALFGGAA